MKKVVVITGCSSGIGKVTANLLAKSGYKVWATMRDVTKERCLGLENVEIAELDVTDDKSVKMAIEKILKKEGRIDVLINNAGFGFIGPLEEFQIDEIKKQYETNIFGVVRTTQSILPTMRKQKGGLIINISSINGLIPFPLYGVYSSSKFALETMTEAMSLELAPFNIKMSLVEPGAFMTNFSVNRKKPIGLNQKSIYRKLDENLERRFVSARNKAETSGVINKLANPERVAKRILKIMQSESPSFRNIVGVDAHIYYFLKKLLPDFAWRKLASIAYRW